MSTGNGTYHAASPRRTIHDRLAAAQQAETDLDAAIARVTTPRRILTAADQIFLQAYRSSGPAQSRMAYIAAIADAPGAKLLAALAHRTYLNDQAWNYSRSAA
jgi:hypothetical protein